MEQIVGSMDLSIQVMSEKYKDQLSHVQQRHKKIKASVKRVQQIEKAKASEQVQELNKNYVAELEWRSRRLNLEIHGMAATLEGNLLCNVKEVAVKLAVLELVKTDVESMPRLPSITRAVPGKIIHFVRQKTKLMCWEKIAVLKKTKDNIL